MSFKQAAWNYKKNAILTAPPEKLVVMLYDGAIQKLESARQQLNKSDTPQTSPHIGEALSKAMGIISELRSSLDMKKGGEIATNLDRLYEFCNDRITQANIKREAKPVAECLTIMRTLREGWEAIMHQGVTT